MIYPYVGILFSHEKEWSSDTGYSVDEPWKHHAQRKKPDAYKPHSMWSPLYEMSRRGQSIEMGSRWVAARGWEGKRGNGYKISFWGNKNILELDRGRRLHSFVDVLKITELHTFKMWNLWYMNYISIKRIKTLWPSTHTCFAVGTIQPMDGFWSQVSVAHSHIYLFT